MQIQSKLKKSHSGTTNENVEKYITYALVQASSIIIKKKLTFHNYND